MPELNLTDLVERAEEQSLKETARPLKAQADALPSPHRDEIQALMRARSQLNFSLPMAIREMFTARARDRGFKWPVHYLYYLMRKDGLEVPDSGMFDGRSR